MSYLDLHVLREQAGCGEGCHWGVIPSSQYADQAQLQHAGMAGEISVVALGTIPLGPPAATQDAAVAFAERVRGYFHGHEGDEAG